MGDINDWNAACKNKLEEFGIDSPCSTVEALQAPRLLLSMWISFAVLFTLVFSYMNCTRKPLYSRVHVSGQSNRSSLSLATVDGKVDDGNVDNGKLNDGEVDDGANSPQSTETKKQARYVKLATDASGLFGDVLLPLVDAVLDLANLLVLLTGSQGTSCVLLALATPTRKAVIACLSIGAVFGLVIQLYDISRWVKAGSLLTFVRQEDALRKQSQRWSMTQTSIILRVLLEDLPCIIATMLLLRVGATTNLILYNVLFSMSSFAYQVAYLAMHINNNHSLAQRGRACATCCAFLFIGTGWVPLALLLFQLLIVYYGGIITYDRTSYHDVSIQSPDGTWTFQGAMHGMSLDHLSGGFHGRITSIGNKWPEGGFRYSVEFPSPSEPVEYFLWFDDLGCKDSGFTSHRYCLAQNVILEGHYGEEFSGTVYRSNVTDFTICEVE